jgi:hypothetical protein
LIGPNGFLPAMAIIYLDVNSLPPAIKAIFCAIPYSQSIFAAKAVVTSDYGTVVFGIVYVAIFTNRNNVYCFAIVCN